MTTKFEDIDIKIEKLVFLLEAEEDTRGIYELTYKRGNINLTIEDNYKIARLILTEIIEDELVVLEKYVDNTLSEKIKTISKQDIGDLLNNPINWFPCNETLAINLTEKGIEYLNKEAPKYTARINYRLTGK
jgi:hypothetical protein